jgi:hypothetical protein
MLIEGSIEVFVTTKIGTLRGIVSYGKLPKISSAGHS